LFFDSPVFELNFPPDGPFDCGLCAWWSRRRNPLDEYLLHSRARPYENSRIVLFAGGEFVISRPF
jgi:hypothetical protein